MKYFAIENVSFPTVRSRSIELRRLSEEWYTCLFVQCGTWDAAVLFVMICSVGVSDSYVSFSHASFNLCL